MSNPFDLSDEEMKQMGQLVDAINSGTGGVFKMTFAHDEGCPTLVSGRSGDCTCNPDISVDELTEPTQ